jgi:hypothetical protein
MFFADTGLTWNVVDDVRRLLEFHFMVNAFRAGTIVAIVAGIIGWFMVVRRQTLRSPARRLRSWPALAPPGATSGSASSLRWLSLRSPGHARTASVRNPR